MKHEEFIEAVRSIILPHVGEPEKQARLRNAKMVYGAGTGGTRGVTYYCAWKNGTEHDFIEVCATGEESAVQLAGTTIHELAHVLAGNGAGHGKDWKLAASVLGLKDALASGQNYTLDSFDPAVRSKIEALGEPTDGAPKFNCAHGAGANPFLGLPLSVFRPCPLGRGTRGGKSYGPGSGSRLLKASCTCGYTIRLTQKWADKGLPTCACGLIFTLEGEKK